MSAAVFPSGRLPALTSGSGQAAGNGGSSTAVDGASLPGLRVWVLDDDEALCTLLSQRLAHCGWHVACFLDPRALDAAMAEEQPDLLVLDEMLPGRSGGELLAGLRQRGQDFPVLMLSALRSAHDRIAGLEAGADDYLGKPFEFRELQLRIERLLDHGCRLRASTTRPSAGYRIASLLFSPASSELRSPDGAITHLSRGDAALLHTLCRRPGEVIGRQILARGSGSLVGPARVAASTCASAVCGVCCRIGCRIRGR